MLPYLAAIDTQHQLAARVDVDLSRPFKRKRDEARIGARRHDEVILELTLTAIVDKVHSRVHTFVFDLGISGNVRAPLRGIVADEIVALARQFIVPCRLRPRIRIY